MQKADVSTVQAIPLAVSRSNFLIHASPFSRPTYNQYPPPFNLERNQIVASRENIR